MRSKRKWNSTCCICITCCATCMPYLYMQLKKRRLYCVKMWFAVDRMSNYLWSWDHWQNGGTLKMFTCDTTKHNVKELHTKLRGACVRSHSCALSLAIFQIPSLLLVGPTSQVICAPSKKYFFECSGAGMDTVKPVIEGVLKLGLQHSFLHDASKCLWLCVLFCWIWCCLTNVDITWGIRLPTCHSCNRGYGWVYIYIYIYIYIYMRRSRYSGLDSVTWAKWLSQNPDLWEPVNLSSCLRHGPRTLPAFPLRCSHYQALCVQSWIQPLTRSTHFMHLFYL